MTLSELMQQNTAAQEHNFLGSGWTWIQLKDGRVFWLHTSKGRLLESSKDWDRFCPRCGTKMVKSVLSTAENDFFKCPRIHIAPIEKALDDVVQSVHHEVAHEENP